jgi:hypothetical protein
MVMKKVVFILLVILTACHQQTSERQVQQEDAKNRPRPTLDQLKGKPFSEAQRLLGKPGYGHDLEYPLWEATNEFRGPLFNYFDIKDSVDLKKRIREATWPYGYDKEMAQHKRLTIWYVKKDSQWVFVDIYDWHEGDEF